MNDNAPKLVHIVRHLDWMSAVEIAAVVAAAWLLSLIVRVGLPWIADRLRPSGRMKLLPWIPVLRFLILLAAIGVIVPIVIRPTLENMVVIFGAAGVAIGFAFKDYLSNVIGGVAAIVERAYRPGDWVRIDDTYGEVRSVGLRSLSLVTPDDSVVFIPHSRLWDTSVFNANAGKRDLMCVADFFLHPDHDAAAVREGLADLVVSSPYVNLDRSITVVLAEEPWGTRYSVKAYPVDSRYQFDFISDLTVRAKMVFARLGASQVTAPVSKAYQPAPVSRSMGTG
jgi:small conductance mechanosensitive channel